MAASQVFVGMDVAKAQRGPTEGKVRGEAIGHCTCRSSLSHGQFLHFLIDFRGITGRKVGEKIRCRGKWEKLAVLCTHI